MDAVEAGRCIRALMCALENEQHTMAVMGMVHGTGVQTFTNQPSYIMLSGRLGWMAGWLAGRLAGWLAGWRDGWMKC